jgi:Zn finger protein HypA/HybF involved in hydrogenase expression
MLGAETAARLRVRFEPWRLDSSETAPSIDELYDEVVAPLPEYPHCACGARLVLDAEQVSGKCEACAIDSAIDSIGQTRTTAAESQSSPANPVDVPLPFPAAPVERFDFHAAFTDIGKHNRDVEARQKVYLDLNERAKDAKKQWEAAASSLTLMIAEYDRKAREAEEAEARQEKLSAAYTEKLEADAAKAAAPELPIAAAPTAESRVMADESAAVDEVPPESGSVASGVAQPNPTPLSDALPTCACGAALALDTERARGECDDCAWQRVEGK